MDERDPMGAASRTALGQSQVAKIGALRREINQLDDLTREVHTVDVHSMPIPSSKFEVLKSALAQDSDDSVWIFGKTADGGAYLCIDEAADGIPSIRRLDALYFPELHSRLIAWWLGHAWRFVDLTHAVLDSLTKWNITIAAIAAQALIETVGCLQYEATRIGQSWADAKALPPTSERPSEVHRLVHPVLAHAEFSSKKLTGISDHAEAINVLTFVDKLAKSSGEPRIREWYDWLANTAHPAIGSKWGYASPPFVGPAGAVMRRYFLRAPIAISGPRPEPLEFLIPHISADTAIAVIPIGLTVLDQALAICDDMGLTTRASEFTTTDYWRKLHPTRGKRACACGRGKWSECGHRWGSPAPMVAPPRAT